jgi:NADPH-dependent 7-cyano-7-deazaguanine reductase QueF
MANATESNWIAHSNDLFDLLQPRWLEVYGDFLPRGGIAIKPKARLNSEPV